MVQVDVKAKQADVIYTTTDEEETIDLEELMKDRCIALSRHLLAPQPVPPACSPTAPC